MKHFTLLLYILLIAATLTSCSNDTIVPEVSYGWGKAMAGNDPDETTWPDLSENYWEFTLNLEKYPKGKVGLKFTGQYPTANARFFNFTLYSDRSTQRLASIEDFNITPNEGSLNPFAQDGVSGANYYEVYALPATASLSGYQNVMTFPENTERLTILLRIYFNSIDHAADFGGVATPKITVIDLESGKELGEAPRAQSLYYIRFAGIMSKVPLITTSPYLVFTLAPDVLYSNGPTGYVTAVNRIQKDSALMFRFIPPTYPKKVSENKTADVRYWSICIGDTTTHTPYTLVDRTVTKSDDGYVNVMIVDSSIPNYNEVKAKAEQLKINLVSWDVAKHGEPLMLFYRQMYINPAFEYSVKKIVPYPELNEMGQPDASLSPIQPNNMAHIVLGEHGPSGRKQPISYFLSSAFTYSDMRMPGR